MGAIIKSRLILLAAILALSNRAGETAPVYPPNAALQYWRAFSVISDFSREDRDLFDQDFDMPPGVKRTELVKQLSPAITFLSRAAKIRGADWGSDFELDGPFARMPHLRRCRELARAALIVARENWDQGRARETVDIIFDVWAMARHAGSDGALISKLVELANSSIALRAFCEVLPKLPAEELEKFDARMAALPPLSTLADAVQRERSTTLWLGENAGDPKLWANADALVPGDDDYKAFRKICASPEKLHTEIKKCLTTFDKWEKAIVLPYPKFADAQKKLEAELPEAGLVAKMFLPPLLRSRHSNDAFEADVQMTRAAVQFVLKGEAGLRDIRDPFGDGPFTYTKLENGFGLQSKLIHNDRPHKMLFGEAARKAVRQPEAAVNPPGPPPDKAGDF